MELKPDKEVLTGREIMRLLKVSRESAVENLLDDALVGRSKDTDTVTRLFRFVRDNFGPADLPHGQGSDVTKKFAKAVAGFLQESGVDSEQISKITNPPPAKGCVLDEFEDSQYE